MSLRPEKRLAKRSRGRTFVHCTLYFAALLPAHRLPKTGVNGTDLHSTYCSHQASCLHVLVLRQGMHALLWHAVQQQHCGKLDSIMIAYRDACSSKSRKCKQICTALTIAASSPLLCQYFFTPYLLASRGQKFCMTGPNRTHGLLLRTFLLASVTPCNQKFYREGVRASFHWCCQRHAETDDQTISA